MLYIEDKIRIACKNLSSKCRTVVAKVDVEYAPCDYKTGNTPPESGWEVREYHIGAHAHFWNRGSFKTPAAEEGYSYVLSAESGRKGWDADNPQGLLYLNGIMAQGLDINHTEAFLEPDTEYTMHAYLYSASANSPFAMRYEIRKVHDETEQLYYDLITPLDALKVLNKNTAEYKDTLSALEQAVNLIDFRNVGSEEYKASIAAARAFMKEEFYEKLCSTEGKPVVHCIGHTHIDVEWLWARAQTREKVQRSISSVLALMDKYPEYRFTLTQPELYRYMKEEAPEKYEELKARIAEERWEPEGAMYVECDCNLTGGESFVRQIMQGKRFFKEEFGKDNKVLFLPDVFGYSAALPQILKKSGVDYFVTSKISWNDTNMMPYDSFYWEGIDGTEIYSSFITTQGAKRDRSMENYTTYVGMLQPNQVAGTWDRYQQKEYNKHTILTYGYGDGGGGPTRWMLEKQRRMAKGLPGMPVTKMDFILPYLKDAKGDFDQNAQKLHRAPKWVGELYLEFHRGTYTSMAANKKGNRKSEQALHTVEGLSFTDLLYGGSYDAKGIYAAWRKVLHNQFHDILPGSSIKEVYDGTEVDYAKLATFTDGIIHEKLQSLSAKIGTDGGIMIYNPSGFARKGAVKVAGETVETEETIPAYGWKVLPAVKPACTVKVEGLCAENEYYKMTLDEKGRIDSLFDKKAEREVLLPGKCGNELELYEDYPRQYDAWEMDATYEPKRYSLDGPVEITPIADGSRAGFKVSQTYQNSTISQKIWLYSKGRRIDFETDLDWHEKHHLMKAAFPIDVHTSSATYEIQFGHVERPTHQNTSWDEAKFEVCAHKWADLSENGYGVALLNDCKYGHSAKGSTLKLTLLKCPAYPNPKADEGEHHFTYSILPHSGSLYESGVIEEAYALNQPMESVTLSKQEGALPEEFSLVSCDQPNIIIETVKKAEDSEDMIVRLYDAWDCRSKATVTVPEGFSSACICSMMEEDEQELAFEGGKVTIPVKNLEIVTLKFKR